MIPTVPHLMEGNWAQLGHAHAVELARLDAWVESCPIENAMQVFTCIECFRLVSWDYGAGDDMPFHCDDCWCKHHKGDP